jgi:hypothetical protein
MQVAATNWILKGSKIYCAKTLLSILLSFRKKDASLWPILFNRSNLQFATSMSGISAFYNLLKSILIGKIHTKYIPAISGSISSLLLLLDRDSKRTGSIAQFVFVRTIYFMIRAFVYKAAPKLKSEKHRNFTVHVRSSKNVLVQWMRDLIDQYGHFIVWLYSSCTICYTSFVVPEYLTKSTYRMLLWTTNSYGSFGKNAEKYVRGMSKLIRALEAIPNTKSMELIPQHTTSLQHYLNLKKVSTGELKDALVQIKEIETFLSPDSRHKLLFDSVQHPNHVDSLSAAVERFRSIFGLTYKSYFILNVFPVAYQLFKSYKNLKDLQISDLTMNALISSIRTCGMTSAYVACFELSISFLRRLFGRERSIS